ncbi:polysaccharide lyase family 1 protein [Piromyces sp. E2]|nr:polysaccharide lyase family 1 protein [Piromyces sp. E2]|eukprot:OUM66491.1 polysaccharide lyase family 1 protein [Piromyces sp. E2]
MKILFFNNIGLLLLTGLVNASSPIGWGRNTTGGEGGVVYHVTTYNELRKALDNHGKSNEPKIIYIESVINGIENEDGSRIDLPGLVPGYSFEKYVSCFTEDGSEWLDTTECNALTALMKQGRTLQNNQVHLSVPPNTTIIGNGREGRLKEISLQVRHTKNVIIKDLFIEAPNDYFPKFKPTDGIHGTWNAEYDTIVMKNCTNIWIDNCYLSDGSTGLDTQPVIFGQPVETHDGLIDIVDAASDITISNNRFENHKKTILIGNSDNRPTDIDRLKVTLYNNVFINCVERLPRVRYGKVHIFNNYYYAITFNSAYPSYTVDNYYHDTKVFPHYFIGLGVYSNILSEYNSFNYHGNKEIPASEDIIVYSYGGSIFHDNGSEYNGKTLNIDTLASKSFHIKSNVRMEQDRAKEYLVQIGLMKRLPPTLLFHVNTTIIRWKQILRW